MKYLSKFSMTELEEIIAFTPPFNEKILNFLSKYKPGIELNDKQAWQILRGETAAFFVRQLWSCNSTLFKEKLFELDRFIEIRGVIGEAIEQGIFNSLEIEKISQKYDKTEFVVLQAQRYLLFKELSNSISTITHEEFEIMIIKLLQLGKTWPIRLLLDQYSYDQICLIITIIKQNKFLYKRDRNILLQDLNEIISKNMSQRFT